MRLTFWAKYRFHDPCRAAYGEIIEPWRLAVALFASTFGRYSASFRRTSVVDPVKPDLVVALNAQQFIGDAALARQVGNGFAIPKCHNSIAGEQSNTPTLGSDVQYQRQRPGSQSD